MITLTIITHPRANAQESTPPDDTLYREASHDSLYVVRDGSLYAIPSAAIFEAHEYAWEDITVVPNGGLPGLPHAGILLFEPPDGTIVREQGNEAVYVFQGSTKFHIHSPEEFAALGYNWEDLDVVPNGTFAFTRPAPQDGTLLRELNSTTEWVIYGGAKLKTSGSDGIRTIGLDPASIRRIPDGTLETIPDIPRDSTLLRDVTDGHTEWVIYGGAKLKTTGAGGIRAIGLDPANIRDVQGIALEAIPNVPRDGTLLHDIDDGHTEWVIYGGAKLKTTGAGGIRAIGLDPANLHSVQGIALEAIPNVPRDGTLLHDVDDGHTEWVIYGGAKLKTTGAGGIRAIGLDPANIRDVQGIALEAIPNAPRDGTLLHDVTNGHSEWVIFGGAKLKVSGSDGIRAIGLDPANLRSVQSVALEAIPHVPRDGTLLFAITQRETYVIIGGAKISTRGDDTFRALGYSPSDVRWIQDEALAEFPAVPRDGTVLQELWGRRLFVIYGGAKFHVADSATLAQIGFSQESVRFVPDATLQETPDTPQDGTLLREVGSSITYVMSGGKKYSMTPEVFASRGYIAADVRVVPNGGLATIADGGALSAATATPTSTTPMPTSTATQTAVGATPISASVTPTPASGTSIPTPMPTTSLYKIYLPMTVRR